jgi:hypothetical protein
MSDGHPIVVLSTTVQDTEVVIGSSARMRVSSRAGEHVGILRDPEMLKRMRHVQQISISQHRLRIPRPSRSGWRNCWAGRRRAA